MTRYARLMQDVIKHGNNNTKVLMLSATPVNNSLVDLKNQISIITMRLLYGRNLRKMKENIFVI